MGLGGMNRDDAGEGATTLRACGSCGGPTPDPPRKRRGGGRAPPSFTYGMGCGRILLPKSRPKPISLRATSLSNSLMTTAARSALSWKRAGITVTLYLTALIKIASVHNESPVKGLSKVSP